MLRPGEKRRTASTADSCHDTSQFMNVEPAEAQFRRPDDAEQPSVGQHRKPIEWNKRRPVDVL